jgi:hypothetical protein
VSRRERVLLVLGVVVAIGLVVYPLAYRISTEQRAGVALAPTPSAVRSSPSASPIPTRTFAPPSIAPTPIEPTPILPSLTPGEMSWQAEATRYRPLIGQAFVFVCPPNGTFWQIWGTDIYTDDSSVCTAAVHRGVITRERGGSVTIIMRKGLDEYKGSARNGVTTEFWGIWEGSYEVIGP